MAKKARKPERPKRPAMTPEEAVSFEEGFSARSAEQIYQQLEARRETGIHADCECEPYDDVFTFNRWRAQGLVVRKGEKSLPLASFVKPGSGDGDAPPPPPDAPDGVQTMNRKRLLPRTLHVFCRCQVDKIEPPK